jgi:hypothetical protein
MQGLDPDDFRICQVREMKSIYYLSVSIAVVLALSSLSISAGEGRSSGPKRGGEADSHMSSKGQENTDAQWSADPERGWVRADEPKENRGQHKGRGPRGKAKGLFGIQ